MWHDLGVAISLLLVLEGILPFVQPERWRKMVAVLSETDNNTLRIMGFITMLIGTAMLYLLKNI